MKHSYIDRYSGIDSFIHRIDPRVKIAGVFSLIFSIILARADSFVSFALYALFIAILIFISKIPLIFILKRSLVVIPFVLMVAIFSGPAIFRNVLVKSYLSVLSMILLVSSTPFCDFLKALEKLKLPRIFTMIISFMYRYIFVIEDELMKMRQAKEARSVGGSKWSHTKALANMLGVLFIRAYERGEKVYLAMCSRGFNGDIRTMHSFRVKRSDLCFLALIVGVLAAIKVIGA
ncbi:MAG: cobalt ECF transporter T component CbiQ [Candidatus Omnitrophica bacterium]|nr:cobalt ECF transporter T component CbiQ [Candidatus Omnitrophota bacterium]